MTDFEGGGCATLTDMYNIQKGDDGPLLVLDASDKVVSGGTPTGRWLMTWDITVVDGVQLLLHGSAVGGDCDVLRIQSDGSSAFHELRGHGGSLSFHSTKVTSWDTDKGEQQKEYKNGRSFINCVSEMTTTGAACAKNNMGECRMVSLVIWLGHGGSEFWSVLNVVQDEDTVVAVIERFVLNSATYTWYSVCIFANSCT